MNAIPGRYKIELVIISCLLILGAFCWMLRTGDDRTRLAEKSYQKGETSTTIAARKESFNKALDLFLTLDADYHPNFGSGKLNFDIGNTYYQLGEYPLSIFYYKRAENLRPRDPTVKRNLVQALKKLGLPDIGNNNLFDSILLKPFLSLPDRLQLFFILGLFTFLLASYWLWTKKQWASNLGIIFLIGFVMMTLNLGISFYFSPVDAVLTHAVELRRDAGEEFAKVEDQPIPGGTIVEVISTSSNGKWLKIVVPGGNFGYAPSEAVKLIDL